MNPFESSITGGGENLSRRGTSVTDPFSRVQVRTEKGQKDREGEGGTERKIEVVNVGNRSFRKRHKAAVSARVHAKRFNPLRYRFLSLKFTRPSQAVAARTPFPRVSPVLTANAFVPMHQPLLSTDPSSPYPLLFIPSSTFSRPSSSDQQTCFPGTSIVVQ